MLRFLKNLFTKEEGVFDMSLYKHRAMEHYSPKPNSILKKYLKEDEMIRDNPDSYPEYNYERTLKRIEWIQDELSKRRKEKIQSILEN